jgi:hypothetical protein
MRRHEPRPHRLGTLAFATLLSMVLSMVLSMAPASVAEVAAATPGLTIVSSASYDVQPEAHRVHVTLDLQLTNRLRDTKTHRFYFDRAFLSVLPGTEGYKLSSSGGGSARARVSNRTATYTVLELDLAARLYSGKSASYTLAFDIVDKGGAPTRQVRVSPSLVSFPVWAFATDSTPGSSVRVTFPAGFKVEVDQGDIGAPKTASDGTVVLESGQLAKPLSFFAYLVADRPSDLAARSATVDVGGTKVELTIQSWPDDQAWSGRVGGLFERALPALSTQLGLPWPRGGGLEVRESVSRSTGGYAGLFDPAGGAVEVAYYASDTVVLHEAAHAWFNGALLADRWANEAFASYYGLAVAPALKVKVTGPALTKELEAARIPLNAWGPVGQVDPKAEAYAYAASLALARAIVERAGDDAIRSVWSDAAAHIGAYQPSATATETVQGPPDWRGLLDLLEARTGQSFEDLWRTWVARDTDLTLLDARTAARTRYDEVLRAANGWQLPRDVRDAMRAWRFDEATRMLTDAQTVLGQRTTIEKRAMAAGLTPPPTLRSAFEGPGGTAAASQEAAAELQAIATYQAAAAAQPGDPDLLQALGSVGADPAGDLVRAKTLFASGDLVAATAAASAAGSTWVSATDIGRGRAVSLALLALAVVFAVVLGLSWIRGRRRRSHVTMAAEDLGV